MGFKINVLVCLSAFVMTILTIASLSMLWLNKKDLQVCYASKAEAAYGCTQTPQFQSAKAFNPNLANVQDCLSLLLYLGVLIYYGASAWSYHREHSADDAARMRDIERIKGTNPT